MRAGSLPPAEAALTHLPYSPQMPVLKQLGPAQPKKRPERGALSISAPLGDFRHTLHVGRGGDAFGDTSFLSRHGGGPPPEPRAPPAGAPPHPARRGPGRAVGRSRGARRQNGHARSGPTPPAGREGCAQAATTAPLAPAGPCAVRPE